MPSYIYYIISRKTVNTYILTGCVVIALSSTSRTDLAIKIHPISGTCVPTTVKIPTTPWITATQKVLLEVFGYNFCTGNEILFSNSATESSKDKFFIYNALK